MKCIWETSESCQVPQWQARSDSGSGSGSGPGRADGRQQTRTRSRTMAPASEQNTWVGALIKSQIFHAMRQAFVNGCVCECEWMGARGVWPVLGGAASALTAGSCCQHTNAMLLTHTIDANEDDDIHPAYKFEWLKNLESGMQWLGSCLACLCTCSHFEFGWQWAALLCTALSWKLHFCILASLLLK